MQQITFTVQGAEFETQNGNISSISDPKLFLEKHLQCPLTFHSFDMDALVDLFDNNWLQEIDMEYVAKPKSIKVRSAEKTDSSFVFDAEFVYEVKLSNSEIKDDDFEEKLSWPTDMIDYLAIKHDEIEFEEVGINEKIGPIVSPTK